MNAAIPLINHMPQKQVIIFITKKKLTYTAMYLLNQKSQNVTEWALYFFFAEVTVTG